MAETQDAFSVQAAVRAPWRAYLDALVPLRPALHRYCCRLTGNIWDGEDLAQDALVRVFSLLGKIDADLDEPRAYLIRTATNLWIDRMRRVSREEAVLRLHESTDAAAPSDAGEVRQAASTLLGALPPKERAAVLLKDVFDLSLQETAAYLKISAGAVKSALHRGRGKLVDPERQVREHVTPPREIVDRFATALSNADLDALSAMCLADLQVELVGGAEMDGFENSRSFFAHAHFVMPEWGFGTNPNWRVVDYDGEPIVLGFRTLDSVEDRKSVV